MDLAFHRIGIIGINDIMWFIFKYKHTHIHIFHGTIEENLFQKII